MPTKKIVSPKAAPKKAGPRQSTPKKAVPRKVTPAKVTSPPEPVEPAVPVEVDAPVIAVPEPIMAPEPVSPAPAPVSPVPEAPYAPPRPVISNYGKPGMVQVIAIMTLINGILNILYGLTVTGAIVLGTFFIGIVCAPITILPVVLGIFEIIYATKLLASPPQPVKPSQALAILEIAAVVSGNVISAVVGILALVFYADANVKAYFARLNGLA